MAQHSDKMIAWWRGYVKVNVISSYFWRESNYTKSFRRTALPTQKKKRERTIPRFSTAVHQVRIKPHVWCYSSRRDFPSVLGKLWYKVSPTQQASLWLTCGLVTWLCPMLSRCPSGQECPGKTFLGLRKERSTTRSMCLSFIQRHVYGCMI